jgi:signal transduction histidine kinase
LIFIRLKKRIRSIIALVLLLIIIASSYGQQGQNKIDSLELVVKNSSGIAKYDPLIALVREYALLDNNEALRLSMEARQLGYDFGDSAKIVNSSRIIGQLLNRLSRSIEAEKILLSVLAIAKRNNFRADYKLILNNLGAAYTIQAKYDKALDANFQALELREADNEKEEISGSLNNIGLVYFKLGNYEKALEFYNSALKLKKEINDSFFLDRLLVNIGLCYNHLKDYAKANQFFVQGFTQCGNNCSEQIMMEGELGLGVSYHGLRDFLEAKKHFNQSYFIAKKIGDQRFMAENLIYLADIHIKEKKNDTAVQILKECEKITMSNGYNELLIETYREFADLFKKSFDYQKATEYQSKYIALKDSIYSGELIAKIAKIQTNFAERQNIKTIASQEELIRRQRNLNIAIVIIAILASLLIFVLYRSNRVKRKVNAALSQAKGIIEDQNRKLLSSNFYLNKELEEKNIDLEKANDSLRKVNEELDNFIYKTSHDIRGPLASLKGMCNVALLDVQDEIALGYLKKLDITAEKLNSILTRLLIVNQINNSTIGSERIDFDTIVSEVLLMERKRGLPARMKIHVNINDRIEYNSDKEFIRIILENLIDNAIKFCNNSGDVVPFVQISICLEGGNITLKVVDNGIGVRESDPEKLFQIFSRGSERSETGGIGLYITKTASEKLGGTVTLNTTAEGYTEFLVKLPLATNRILVG